MKELPSSGEVEIEVLAAPVSVQAARAEKDRITEAIRHQTRAREFVITDDVWLDVEWFVSEHERYETDQTPDVDNIMKPIMDALCGPEGILIDDCQVQSLTVSWLANGDAKQSFRLRVRTHDSAAWLPKADLSFARFANGLCIPVSGTKEIRALTVANVQAMLDSKEKLLASGAPLDVARQMLPVQRFFHRTRLHGFPVQDAEAILADRLH